MSTEYSALVRKLRNAFNSGRTLDIEFRKRQLEALRKLMDENEEAFVEALQKDLGKPKQETVIMELITTKGELDNTLNNLEEWAKPERVSKTLITLMESVFIHPEPYGVTLLIGPWNYPAHLIITPLIGAISAGNCAIIKPSELAEATAQLFAQLIPKYLDQDCYAVVLGGPKETSELLKERYDYIFYTGSTRVGQIVREAANKYLTPCLLELGGKSPVFIDDDCDMFITARRVIWGKCANMGQTCVAPDYILCSKSAQERFIEKAKIVLREFFGDDPSTSPSLARIINDHHFKRIVGMMRGSGEVAVGGNVNQEDRYIAPTILINIKETDPIMQEEIFGPVLPIYNVNSLDEAIDFINSREKPLTLYCFSNREEVHKKIINSTSSGSVLGNDTMLHLSVETLPFGGVGNSGIGKYHGKASFDSYSHRKSCLVRDFSKLGEHLALMRYPPYNDGKISKGKFILKKRKAFKIPYFSYIVTFFLGVYFAYLFSLVW